MLNVSNAYLNDLLVRIYRMEHPYMVLRSVLPIEWCYMGEHLSLTLTNRMEHPYMGETSVGQLEIFNEGGICDHVDDVFWNIIFCHLVF